MQIHFIAIGGSAMHNLALALHDEGHEISGSDDEIYEPSRSRLLQAGILPPHMGWYTEKIVPSLDAVILGMHAKEDNPELLRALQLGMPVYSYPEFVFNQSKNKHRIVITGSHGKTTTTSIIMHVLRYFKVDFDYLVGAGIDGFDRMVKLSDAPIIIIEGDEYLSSPIDRRPKMLHYRPHVAVMTGIAWDHINVFPTFSDYKYQFKLLIDCIEPKGKLIYYKKDRHIIDILSEFPATQSIELEPYDEIKVDNGCVVINGESFDIHLIGSHNRQNIDAAWRICRQLDITETQFYKALQTFTGAKRRLQVLSESDGRMIYLDFAHAPSKVEATTKAVAETFSNVPLLAVFELHTFSSLNDAFLPEYQNTLNAAEKAIIYLNAHTLEMKGMNKLDEIWLSTCFNHKDLTVITDTISLERELKHKVSSYNGNILLMSSGNFGGLDLSFIKK